MTEIKPDSSDLIQIDASELVADYASSGSVCDELYDGILGLLDRQAALTEQSCAENARFAVMKAYAEFNEGDDNRHCRVLKNIIYHLRQIIVNLEKRIGDLECERDRLRKENGRIDG